MALPLIARLLQFRQFESVYAALNALSEAAEARLVAIVANTTIKIDEWTNPAAVSTTALLGATLITSDPPTVLAAALSSGGKAAALAYPRNFTVTGGGTTAHCPTQVVATGTDYDGNALTETLALSGGSGTGVKAFKTYTSFVFTGADPAGDGSCAIGIGKKFGLSAKIKSRAGLALTFAEVAIGAKVTTGTIVDAATSPPHGTYAPSANPNGTTDDFALAYEQDLS